MGLTQITTGGVDDNINIDSNTLKVDGSNNRVGIGTASPSNLLHISGSSAAQWIQFDGSQSNLLIGQNTGTSHFGQTNATKLMANNSSNPFVIGNNQAQPLILGTSSAERLRIDSSGRLLRGTTSTSANANTVLQGSSGGTTGAARLFLQRGSAPANGQSMANIFFADNSSNEGAKISAIRDGGSWTSGSSHPTRLEFATTANGASSPTERMRIDNAGNIGIGISNPLTKLHLPNHSTIRFGTSGAAAKADISYSSTGFEFLDIKCQGTTNGYGNIRFYTGATPTERMLIDSSGRVGIGDTSLVAPLHVRHNSTATSGIVRGLTLKNGNATNDNRLALTFASINNFDIAAVNGVIESHAGQATNAAGRLEFYTNASGDSSPTERMRISSSGNVNIGVNASSNPFTYLRFGASEHGAADIRPTNEGSHKVGLSFYTDGTQDTTVNPTERLRIDSSGRLGIGTSSPGCQTGGIHVVHDATEGTPSFTGGEVAIFQRNFNSGQGCHIGIIGGSSGTSSINFGDKDDADRGIIQYAHGDDSMRFYTNAGERIRLTSGGDVRVKDFVPRISAAISSVSANYSSYFGASGTTNNNLPMIIERYNDNGVSIEFKRSNSVVGNINVTATSTNFATSSDHRLKENVVDLDGAITRVKQLAPKRFNFIADADTTVDGFLAHEAATVVPEAVTGTHNEVDDENNPVYQGIDQSKLVPLLTAALQEAIGKIETLETKVAALEAAE